MSSRASLPVRLTEPGAAELIENRIMTIIRYWWLPPPSQHYVLRLYYVFCWEASLLGCGCWIWTSLTWLGFQWQPHFTLGSPRRQDGLPLRKVAMVTVRRLCHLHEIGPLGVKDTTQKELLVWNLLCVDCWCESKMIKTNRKAPKKRLN